MSGVMVWNDMILTDEAAQSVLAPTRVSISCAVTGKPQVGRLLVEKEEKKQKKEISKQTQEEEGKIKEKEGGKKEKEEEGNIKQKEGEEEKKKKEKEKKEEEEEEEEKKKIKQKEDSKKEEGEKKQKAKNLTETNTMSLSSLLAEKSNELVPLSGGGSLSPNIRIKRVFDVKSSTVVYVAYAANGGGEGTSVCAATLALSGP